MLKHIITPGHEKSGPFRVVRVWLDPFGWCIEDAAGFNCLSQVNTTTGRLTGAKFTDRETAHNFIRGLDGGTK